MRHAISSVFNDGADDVRFKIAGIYAVLIAANVASHAKLYNQSFRGREGKFSVALPRFTLSTMSFADFVQTKGFGSALFRSM
jgi:hypothetical protein